MSLPTVSILLQNGQLGGLVQFAEGVAGMIITGSAVSGKIGTGDPRVVFNLQDAIDLGITVADNPIAYRQVKEFYDEAGAGAELYIMVVPDTMEQTEMLDETNANGAVKLLDYAQGRVRMLGSVFNPPGGYTLDDDDGLDADVFTAITKAHALGTTYATNHTPVRTIIEGRAYTGTPADLTDIRTLTKNRAGVFIGGSLSDGSSSVGLILGRFAKNPVQRKPSRVKDGSVNILTAYVGADKVEDHSGIATIHDKGYMTFRTFPGKTGYFFTGDPVAAPTTDDYCQFARGRVIDKASVIAYVTFLNEVDDEIVIQANGTLQIGMVKHLEKLIKDQINEGMTALGEISSVECAINPAQNVLSTNKIKVVLKIVPVGYLSTIEVELGFDNPAN